MNSKPVNEEKSTAKARSKFDHAAIDKKWQEKWEKERLYSPDNMLTSKETFYNLWMFPYPSAEGLHAGHAFAATGSDIQGRYNRMLGKIVFQPIGYDSFGIHSENFAIKINDTPWNLIDRARKNYRRQLSSVGLGYDWNRTVATSDPDYYSWTQWLFVQLFKAGLAYRAKHPVNWCPGCKTVIADEQIMTPAQAGKIPPGYNSIEEVPEGIKVCERCGNIPEIKNLEQWFFRITEYADRLLEGQEKIDWSERVSVAQRNWIGKSEGAYVEFEIKNSERKLKIFTTAIDTIFGATFMVVSPQHPILQEVEIPKEQQENVSNYIKEHSKETKDADGKEKTGVFTGLFVKHPLKDADIPVWVSDYVLMEYGTGAIMAVPAHDARDREFAQNFDLPIIPVIKPKEGYEFETEGDGFWDYGHIKTLDQDQAILFDSESYSGLPSNEAKEKLLSDIERAGIGQKQSNYHLRDWLISRQRYWGPPIPMIHCSECERSKKSWFDTDEAKEFKVLREPDEKAKEEYAGWYPVTESDLPVTLPIIEDYKPKGEGRGPLADHPEFYEVTCPACGSKAKRETDVSDTFLDSSWYFLRYPTVGSNEANSKPFDPEITQKWLPVNLYFGGAEHAVLHLMYARFVTKVLYDLQLLSFDEPFPKFFAHGLMIKDGAKMSKSRGNVVNPDEYIEKFGADTLRLYLMFMGPMDGYPDFRDTGIEGMRRFVERVWNIFSNTNNVRLTEDQETALEVMRNKTIKRVTSEVENIRYNTAISAIMEYVNLLREYGQKSTEHKNNGNQTEPNEVWNNALETLAKLLAPFAPHMTEEVWVEKLGNEFSVHTASWPTYDESLLEEENVTIVVQVNGKLRANITVPKDDASQKETVIALAKEHEGVQRWIAEGTIKNEVFVPGKLVNFVVSE